jgi:peptidoglycan/LPS O-acetylase OafA/YrhL
MPFIELRRRQVLAMRIHALDGLRAVAASLIVIYHLVGNGSGLVAAFVRSTTPSGVDLFFVLSGVVLAPRHIREDRPLFACDYFRRRAQRLWPPYVFAWLLAGITIAITTVWPTWWSKSAYLPSFKAETWLGQAFIINWWSAPYSFPWWSLTVEVSFYAILPLLIPVFRAIRPQPAIVLGTFCGALLFSGIAYDRVEIAVIRDLVNYAACFTAGLVLASQEVSSRCAYVAVLGGVFLTAVWRGRD